MVLAGQEGRQEDPSGNTEGKKALNVMASPRLQGMGEVSSKKEENKSRENMMSKRYDNVIITAPNKVYFSIKIYHV